MLNHQSNMKPSEIRFSQDDIGPNFSSNGKKKVNDVIHEILQGETFVSDFPPISVWYKNGSWYSENNRRLYMFRVLEYKGKISDINVTEDDPPRWRPNTSRDDGDSIRLRGGAQTYPHSIEEIRKAKRGRAMPLHRDHGNVGSHQGRQEVVESNQGFGWGTAALMGGALLAAGAAAMASSNRENNQNDRRRQQPQPENPRNEDCATQ
ncbi:uncharacterized protein LOC120326980 [Styela clava]